MGATLSSVARLGAALSSTSLDAARCIDGDTSTVCSSMASHSPWLSVTLPAPSDVAYVVLYHNPTCAYPGTACAAGITPLQLWVGAALGDHTSATSTPCGLAHDMGAVNLSAGCQI